MEVRQMATAFLFNGKKVLMMKRSGSRLFSGEFWTGLGGHLEPEELNSPKEACLREIYEESGIAAKDIAGLKLRYILLRNKEGEIRQQFVYFGRAAATEFISSEEGELHWTDLREPQRLPMSAILRFMLEHYLRNLESEQIFVGTMTLSSDKQPQIQWTALQDPIVF
ncbi:NUDIX domain-containing protein [Paenibacillus thermotolerans]|uniref:NUDIX domain-containing protein n=1 Tax=Paenibacillus thermotolerans TaxID=3027807 RepID=UPI002367A0EB|nr:MULTISPECIES: NUDIX hydrolase [unclassified Paenibacillus]